MQHQKCKYDSFTYKEFGILNTNPKMYHCSYDIMYRCWDRNPKLRPSFTTLKDNISDLREDVERSNKFDDSRDVVEMRNVSIDDFDYFAEKTLFCCNETTQFTQQEYATVTEPIEIKCSPSTVIDPNSSTPCTSIPLSTYVTYNNVLKTQKKANKSKIEEIEKHQLSNRNESDTNSSTENFTNSCSSCASSYVAFDDVLKSQNKPKMTKYEEIEMQ